MYASMGFLGVLIVAAIAVTAVSATYVPHSYYCSAPRAPLHGRYSSHSGGHGGQFHTGDVVYFSCDYGYELQGYSRTYCYYDDDRYRADWRYPTPVCKRRSKTIDCGDLDDPAYGDVDFTTTTFRSKATYSCDDGFFLVGDRVRVCQSNGEWSGNAPVCKPVDCGDLDDPDYGDVEFDSTTFNSVATYSCDDGFLLVGVRKRVCQASGRWSGIAPVCRPVDCGDLDDPENGDVSFRATTFWSRATYSCDDGFFLVGDKTRVCQANGKWSGEAPVCNPVDCGDLNDPENGNVDFDSTTFWSRATYSCDNGYFLVGSDKRVCQANGRWSGDAPVCRPVDCGDLDDPENGDVDFDSTTFRSVATYTCDDGYILVGDETRVCQANRKWSGDAPVCEPVDCGDLDDPENGEVDFDSTTFESVATYRCDDGHFLVGDETRVCQANGKWSGEAPVCEPVDCGLLEPPENGGISYDRPPSTTFGSQVIYSCDDGFFLVGDRIRVCQANGEWSGEAPVCEPVDCGDLVDPENGDVDFDSTIFRSVAYYSCDDGYFLVGQETRICQAIGKWSGEAPVCEPVDCGDLDDPENGQVDFTSTTFKSRATYSCDYGYILVGRETRICQANGKWSGEAPVCEPVDCGDLDDPENGDVDFDSTTFRSVATYSCDDGYILVGDETRVCQANGKWSGDAPVCEPVDCGDLDDPENGDVDFDSTTFRSRATYSCDYGYILVGRETRICQANGKWSGEAPVCKPVDCGDLDDPENGNVDFDSTTFRSVATYSCDDGYILVGDETRVCRANGKWSGDAPVCEPVDCGDLDDPENGQVDFTTTTFRSRATYSCDDGYILVGRETRVCQANGKWSGEAPVCEPVDCGDLDDPENGDVDFDSTTFRSVAIYSCDDGFFLVGDKRRVCQANGKWSGEAPVCRRVDCGDLDDPENGDVSFRSTTFLSRATYSCDKGFVLVGSKTRICQANGRWSGEAPVCKRVGCGRLPDPDFGFVRLTGTTVGSKAIYSCNKGFWLEGDSTRVCQHNGQWSGEAPTCKRRTIDCPELPHPYNGWANYHCTRVGCRAHFYCRPGYSLSGSSWRVCREDGRWSGTHPWCVRSKKHY